MESSALPSLDQLGDYLAHYDGGGSETTEIPSLGEIDEYLEHYASKYYDPEKARQYYLRTRELKGKREAQARDLNTDTKKTAWAVTQENLKKSKSDEQKKNRVDQSALLLKLRTTANETRERLREKLTNFMSSLKSDLEADVQAERDRLASALESRLLEIPDNATPARRAYLSAQNAKIRQQMTATSNAKIQKMGAETREKAAANRVSTRAEMLKVSTELKSTLTAARDSYESKKADLVKRYEADREQEYKNIKSMR